jgi:actin
VVAYSLTTSAERETVRDIKEILCFRVVVVVVVVVVDFKEKMKEKATESSALGKSVELPDGSIIVIGNERFSCPEVLFQPNCLMGADMDGVGISMFWIIKKCDKDIQKELYANIVLFGGSKILPGTIERLSKNITALAAASIEEVKIVALPERKYSAYNGGSIVASLSTHPKTK